MENKEEQRIEDAIPGSYHCISGESYTIGDSFFRNTTDEME